MKAWIAVLATAAALSVVTLAPATADHKPNCGKRMVETGYFFGGNSSKIVGKFASKYCRAELVERGKALYGSAFTGIEKSSYGCKLEVQGTPFSKFWCVCSGEPCFQYTIKLPPQGF